MSERTRLIPTSEIEELTKRNYEDEPQPSDDIRSPFQHDKDRIIHSTAFRRLQYKTQVYVFHESDLYRTRLSHSLEVAQIAQSIAQGVGADADLTEAISLAHDLGQPPFGHVGERCLKELLGTYNIKFEHNYQSFKIVTDLEERYPNFKGLNLTHATLEGMLRHSSYFEDEEATKEIVPKNLIETFWSKNYHSPPLEAQIVNIADCIAYATHDIEDALEVGLLEWNELKKMVENIGFVINIIDNELSVLMDDFNKIYGKRGQKTYEKIRIRTLSRLLISNLIIDTIKCTKENLSEFRCDDIDFPQQIRKSKTKVVDCSSDIRDGLKTLVKEIVEKYICHEPRVMIMELKAERVLRTLFKEFMKKDGQALPARTRERLQEYGEGSLSRVVMDHISGMTDKYAMDRYQLLTQAYEKAL